MTSSMASFSSLTGFSTENVLDALLSDSADGIVVINTALTVLHINSFFNNFYNVYAGQSAKVGSPLISFSDISTNQKELLAYIKQAFAGKSIKTNLETLENAGIYNVSIHPLKNNLNIISGATIRVSFSDSTSKPATIQSEKLLETLLQNSSDAFLLADADFKVNYVSDNIESILNIKSNELLGTNGLHHAHPDDLERLTSWFAEVLRNSDKLLTIEYRIKNKDGQWIWIEKSAHNRLSHPGTEAIVISIRNIQAKKMADYALIQSEQRLSLLLNNTEESFIILNSRLRVTAYNRAAQEHSPNFFKDELQSGISILDLIAADDLDNTIALFEKVFEGAQVERETTSICAGGHPHIYSHIYRPLVDGDNDIFGVFITSTDITKRKLAEQQVKESEIRFKTIIQESFDAVIILNADGLVIYSSPSITNVLGYTSEDLDQKNGFDYIEESFLKDTRERFAALFTEPGREQMVDVKMRAKNGEYLWVEVKGKNMLHSKYVEGILVSLRNITDRKKAEEFILLSEQRFKGLVQSGADMISILDTNYIVQYSSPTVKSIIGIDPSYQHGRSILENVHPDDLDFVREKFDGLWIKNRTQVYIGPYRYKNYEGKFFWLESTLTNLIGDPSIKGIVLNSRDITERKKLTEDLAVNTDRLKTAQKIARLGYFEYDFLNSSYFFSEEFYEVLDLTNEKLDSWNFEEVEKLIHPADKKRVKVQVEKAIKNAMDFTSEMRLIMKNGKQKIISAIGVAIKNRSGHFEKLSVTLQDITDTRMATLAFQTMEGRFRSLFENSIDGVLITSPAGVNISANPAMCRLLGYTEKELLALDRSQLMDVASDEVTDMISSKEQHGMFIGEIFLKHKQGYFIPVEISSIKMKDAEGNIYFSNIIRDITQKKKIEEEQKSLTQELIKNNQDLQQFSFITSHNLRAPVANLISLLSLFDKENPAEEFNKLLIDKFEEATKQLNSTLNDLINVLVIKSNTNVEKEILSFSLIYENVKKTLESLLYESGGTITADFSEIDAISYNRIHLESIFLNLLSNAIRYRAPERKLKLSVKSYQADQWVIVSFTDNGLGIDLKRYGDRIFGLYQRFHQSKEGKGLGLYMVNSQVNAMGGKIEVESEPDKGTTFKLFFKK